MKPLIFNTNLHKSLIFIILFLSLYFCTGTPVQAEDETASSTPEVIAETPTSTPESEAVIPITVNLNLRHQNNLIFSSLVSLPTSTTITDNSGAEHFTTSANVLTALIAADAASENFNITELRYYQDYQSFYLNCIDITAPAPASLCGNWNYVVNGNYPSVGMDQYSLQGNENIYIYFDNPWKITASTSIFSLGATTTLQTWRYNFDDLENEWTADPNNLIDISVNNPSSTGWWDTTKTIATTTSDNHGQIDYNFNATGTFYAKITSPDWTKWSNPITITVLEASVSSTTTTTDHNDEDNINGGGGGTIEQPNNATTSLNHTITASQITDAVNKILAYLQSQQDDTGKIIDGTITDWAIMSFGANNQYADEIKNNGASLLDYEKNYNLDEPSDLNACASYPRHILALLSAGVGKDDAAIVGLKNKIITACYQNNLYGLTGINDDVFALLGLLVIDTPANEPIITDIINTIKADQNTDGAFTWTGWAGADMTGAALNGLKYAESKGAVIEQEIYSKAKQYLKTNQLADGGWGYGVSDVLTTSWALMGINALGERQNDWFNTTGTNPWYPLVNQLNSTGFYESAWVPGTVDWFALKHAVPALLGKSWPITMPVKITKFETGSNITYTGGGTVYTPPLIETPTTTATTTCTDALQCVSTPTTTEPITQITEPTHTTTSQITNYQLPISPANGIPSSQRDKQIQNANDKKVNNDKQFNLPRRQAGNLTISPAPTSTAPANPAKTVFGISLTAASGLGLYLTWRLLQTLV